ncbi:MAG: serine/threonine protein kinase [Verrucomicrobia bacterium]|nr:serine/threonine protein kinase [Verrucomicrobiota bacterium]
MLSLFKKGGESDDDAPGMFGRFQLHELINTGGMAQIWLATDSKARTYALRRLLSSQKHNGTSRRRFRRGCEILASVQSHDNVIGYYEHGKQDGQYYCLMDYIEGDNLKELYARHDPVLLENVAQIILDAAAALEHVHESGYMHLDFKPENLHVSRNGVVKLVDFDLAQPITGKPHRPSKNPGTPAYMAPEQLKGEPFDHRVDIFAFGVSAYELLTNFKPFEGETPTEIVSSQSNPAKLIPPRRHNPDLPPKLEATILRCLQFDPNQRYGFMSMLNHDLKSVLYV